MRHCKCVQSVLAALLFAFSAVTLSSEVPRPFTPQEEALFRKQIQPHVGAVRIWIVHGTVYADERLAGASAEVIVEPFRAGERFCLAPAVVYESDEHETFENADWKLAGPFVRYRTWDVPDNTGCTQLSFDAGFWLNDRIDTDTLVLIVDSSLQMVSDSLKLLADETHWTPPAATAFELKSVQLTQQGKTEAIRYETTLMAGSCTGVSADFRIIRGEIRVVDAFRVVC